MKAISILALVAVLLVGIWTVAAAPAQSGGTALQYEFPLAALNHSGVSGDVRLVLRGTQLQVHVEADGLEPNRVHPQHIHGHLDFTNATCPGPDADTDGDGFISFVEGLPFYGPVVVPLQPYPTASADGEVRYDQTLTVDPGTLGDLQNRTVVLHGMTVNGSYVPSLPVACAEIVPDN